MATVNYMHNGEDFYGKINGRNGVLLSFHKRSDYSTSQISVNLQKEFRTLENQHKGLTFTTLFDQGEHINIVIDSVLHNLLIGGLLAIPILLFFLRDIRPTLITALSIPISVTFGFTLMYFTGATMKAVASGLTGAQSMETFQLL